MEQEVNDITLDETKRAISWLKIWNSGSNGIPAELKKYDGTELYKITYELCKPICNEEKLTYSTPAELSVLIIIINFSTENV